MLSKLLAMPKAELKSKLQAVDASAVKGRGLRRRFEKIRAKQGGFTLLELLVVVAIMAAIASTATFLLQDTDRRAAAGAHVTMMDQVARGILQFQKLNNAKLPDNWDSLFASEDGISFDDATPLAILSGDLLQSISQRAITSAAADVAILQSLNDAGITKVRVVNNSASADGVATDGTALTCDNTDDTSLENGGKGIRAVIDSKANDVTPQNIFRTEDANGCGGDENVDLALGIDANGNVTGPAANLHLMEWTGNMQRVGVPLEVSVADAEPTLIAFGIGPDATLFDSAKIGSLYTPPVYRHVESHEYNRFIVLFNVSNNGPATLQAIIDGAGDTKDEELGEVDGVRPT
jgi:prepilin-type N-terminal cleavage/methylation domain-containing protein